MSVRGFDLSVGGARFRVLVADDDAEPLSALTAAERDVALAFAAGESHADIAARRGSSVRTVGNQLASVYAKLGVSSRAELIARLTRT